MHIVAADAIDNRLFRDALAHYASGITVIGVLVDGEPVGFTCQSFYSVSMAPPLVSFSVKLTSKSWPPIRDTGSFSVNILSHQQRTIAENSAHRRPTAGPALREARRRAATPLSKIRCCGWIASSTLNTKSATTGSSSGA
jgi:flavin reductase (DIM6/NTAB) family NADH-FMN oxidoreductase RutF